MRFDQFDLDPRLLEAIATAGFTEPTPIQERAIPVVLEGQDVIGIAQTGTGKTAAFGLPILHHLLQKGAGSDEPGPGESGRSPSRRNGPRGGGGRRGSSRGPTRRAPSALIVAPTRELADQIRQSLDLLSRYTKVQTMAIYGGVSKVPQTQALRRGVDIVVACPGRLLDVYGDGALDLSQIRTVVLDEADHMLDMGFLPDVRRILQLLPSKRQTLLFSATMPKEIRGLAQSSLINPQEVKVGRVEPAATVSQGLYEVRTPSEKTALLISLLEELRGEKVLVFTRTKHRAKSLAQKLERAGHRVSALQGNMAQNQRDRAISGFKSGKLDVMVATDIAARGIDVAEIAQVINYDITDTIESYTHRIGRTGRARKTGRAVTFIVPDDREMLRLIERSSKGRIERLALPDAYKAQAAAALAAGDPPARNGGGGGSKSGSRSPNGSRSGSSGGRRGREGRASDSFRREPAAGLPERQSAGGQRRRGKPAPERAAGRPERGSSRRRSGGGRNERFVEARPRPRNDMGWSHDQTDRDADRRLNAQNGVSAPVLDFLSAEDSSAPSSSFGRRPRRRDRR